MSCTMAGDVVLEDVQKLDFVAFTLEDARTSNGSKRSLSPMSNVTTTPRKEFRINTSFQKLFFQNLIILEFNILLFLWRWESFLPLKQRCSQQNWIRNNRCHKYIYTKICHFNSSNRQLGIHSTCFLLSQSKLFGVAFIRVSRLVFALKR